MVRCCNQNSSPLLCLQQRVCTPASLHLMQRVLLLVQLMWIGSSGSQQGCSELQLHGSVLRPQTMLLAVKGSRQHSRGDNKL